MAQTIKTTYLGPTNFRGSRIKARTISGRDTVTLGWDHALNSEANHIAAARALAAKMKWGGSWVMGDNCSSGYLFINLSGAPSGFRSESEA